MTAALVLLAAPKPASAYVDPGSGAMLWQLLAASAIGSLFYLRRLAAFIRTRIGLKSVRSLGFLFATCYALAISPLLLALFNARPIPRFNDIFLVGIVLTAYFFTWDSAAYLLVVALAVTVYALPHRSLPNWALSDIYRLISFGAVSIFLICLITRMKAGMSPSRFTAAEDELQAGDIRAFGAGQKN